MFNVRKQLKFIAKNVVTISLIFFFISFSFNLNGIETLGAKKNLFRIDSIEIQGVKKVEKEAVLEKINSKKNSILDNYTLKRDLEKIYGMKYFESVEAHRKTESGKNILIFKLKEKPLIGKISIIGNDEVETEDITAQIKSKEFSILDVNTLKIDIGALQKLYEEKGFYLASISYSLKNISKENVEVIFNIKEFDKVRVKKIIFLGNSAFVDEELKGIMETKEEGLFSGMGESGSFREFNFHTDIERIKYFYKTKGYLQVGIGTPQITISEDKKWVFVTLKLIEGPQFSINKISFQGEILFPNKNLKKKISLKEGSIYSEQTLRIDIQRLTELYQDEGYAFANVLRTLNVIPGENKVNVEFSFEKGKIAHFGKIIIKGNTRTRDKVIRRELRIQEGQKFSGRDLRRSKENVNRLGFFEVGAVVFNTVSPPGKDDVLDVEVTVKERNTGQIQLGAGYSSASGGFLNASIAETNFMGYGQNLSFSTQFSENQQTFNLGFTEPYLFDSKWTAGFDLFRSLTKNKLKDSSEEYKYRRKGFSARIGYPIFDYTRLFLTYKFENTYIQNSTDPTIKPELENGIASSITTSIVRDKRNNRMEPSAGYYLRASTEYAGIGGDKKWLKYEGDARYFYKVYGDLIFRTRLSLGKMERVDGQEIPLTENYKLGGQRSLRGYHGGTVGPTQTFVVDEIAKDYVVGGLFSIFGTIEFEHPMAREAGLKWVVFFDAGNVFRKKMGEDDNYSLLADYGVGFRWFSPIGVLRFEFGFPLNKMKNQEDDMKFFLDIGQLF